MERRERESEYVRESGGRENCLCETESMEGERLQRKRDIYSPQTESVFGFIVS